MHTVVECGLFHVLCRPRCRYGCGNRATIPTHTTSRPSFRAHNPLRIDSVLQVVIQPSQPVTQQMAGNVLALRGGLLEAEGTALARLYVLKCGIDAGLATISGARSMEDVVENLTNRTIAASLGFYLLTDGILGGTDQARAVVLGSLPRVVGGIKSWMDDEKKLNISPNRVGLVVAAFLTYCLHTGTILEPDLALKLVGAISLVNGMGGMVSKAFGDVDAEEERWPWTPAPSLTAGFGAAVSAIALGSSDSVAIAFAIMPILFASFDALVLSNTRTENRPIAWLTTAFEGVVVMATIL